MKKLLSLIFLLPLVALAGNGPFEAPYGVANTFDFVLYNSDGTLDTDEADGGTEVSVSCDEGAETTATNDFVDEGTFYSIALTAAEMSCERIAVVVAATDTEVFFIRTNGVAPDKFHVLADATGTTTTTDLTGSASATDDFYNGYVMRVFDVSASAWYQTTITDYVGSTNVATHEAIQAAVVSGDALILDPDKRAVLTVTGGVADVNVIQVSGDSTAADNAESFFDGTGYGGANNVIPTVTTVTNGASAANLAALRRGISQIDTTIATLASQVSFTLTDGSPDDDAYNGCGITVTDQSTADQMAFGGIQDYTGSTQTVTLDADPGIFTMAVSDLVTISCQAVTAEFMNKSEVLGDGSSGDKWRGN